MTWYIIGNSNIDPTKFLGTINNQPLIIKTNQLADNSEKMRINPDGNVGIGKAPASGTPYKLDVAGTINATDIHKNGAPLSVSQWTDAAGGISYEGGSVGIGKAPSATYKLDVAGTINATEIHKNGVPLGGTASQWDDVSGGINYAGGNVGVGTTNPTTAISGGRALHVDNPTGASALRLGDGAANGQQWEWQSTVINGVGAMNLSKLTSPAGNPLTVLATGNVGIGTAGPLYRLHVVAPGGFGAEDSNGVSLAGNVPLIAQSNSTAIGIINGNGRQAFALNIDGNGGATNTRGVPTLYDKYDGTWHQCISLKNGRVGIGTYDPQGKLDVSGDIRAGNSDIYFTRTDHNHTGIGNTAGYAAIENAANYGALMILGRAGTSRGRYVRLWDYLQVNGGMDVTGSLGVGTAGSPVKLHAVGNRIRIDNGGGRTLDLRADGSALDLESNGADLYINNNGVPVRIRNQQSVSSRDLKDNIADFTTREATEALEGLNPVSFTWKDDGKKTRHIGFITEDAPRIAKSADEKAIIPVHILAILSKVLQEQQRSISAQEVEEVFPELVSEHGDEGHKAVNYSGFTGVLIEATKE